MGIILDYVPDYQLITLALGLVTAILGFISTWAAVRLRSLEAKIEKLREWGKGRSNLDYLYLDVIFLGPRSSGKTRVAELWSTTWSDVRRLHPTEEWTVHEMSVFEMGKGKFFDDLFEINRDWSKELRLRINDYPGEDRFLFQALEKIPEVERVVLLLFFLVDADSSGPIATNKNNRYYSRAFVDEIEKRRGLVGKVEKVIVVFNKRDLLPKNWSDKQAEERLREINRDAINRVESLFTGKLEFLMVSAEENTHLISLLGSVSSVTLKTEERQKLEREMHALHEKRA